MKTDWFKPFLLTGAVCLLGSSTAHAQIIEGFTGAFAPENWTLSATVDAPYNGGYAEFINMGGCGCGGDDYLLNILGGDTSLVDPEDFITGPSYITASITVSSPVTFTFAFQALSQDEAGWDFDAVGYTIQRGGDLITVSLSPPTGYDVVMGDNFSAEELESAPPELTLLPPVQVELFEDDVFSFFVSSAESDYGSAILGVAAPTAVPEPGEWMALAGVGLIGFAGVRRWRQNKAVINN